MIQLLLSALLWNFSALAAQVPDFKSVLYHGDSRLENLWAIEIVPPAGHHFNLEAPFSAQQEKTKLEATRKSPESILFQTEAKSIRAGTLVEISAFLCDEKKTYCIRKKTFVTLNDSNAKIISEKFNSEKQVKIIDIPKKDTGMDPFIDQDMVRAIEEAKERKKLLLVDFYGIWCPPCNLYSETIFTTPEFSKLRDRFVMVKLDADDERSWKWKSQFKVGGYPTLLVIRLAPDATMTEIDRIVGYFPPDEFYKKVNLAFDRRNDSPEQRWEGRVLERLERELEQKNYDEVISRTEASKDPGLLVFRWIAFLKKTPEYFKEPRNLSAFEKTLDELDVGKASFSTVSLLKAVDLIEISGRFNEEKFQLLAERFLDELIHRVDPQTLFVRKSELSLSDLHVIRMQLFDEIKQPKQASIYRKKAIEAYSKMIRNLESKGQKELRSLNLEYAALLWQDGQWDAARKIYARFIQKFPKEFTFYFAAAKMFLTQNDLISARDHAEKAFQYSYGDNRLRALDRVLQIMKAQGKSLEAYGRGEEFLKSFQSPEGLEVRTHRYLEALRKTLSTLKTSKE